MKKLSKLTLRHGSITRVICPTVRSIQSRETDAMVHDARARRSYEKVMKIDS